MRDDMTSLGNANKGMGSMESIMSVNTHKTALLNGQVPTAAVVLKVSIPAQKLQKVLRVNQLETIWTIK